MKYMLLLLGDESGWAEMTEEEARATTKAYEDYSREVIEAGVHAGGEGLQPSATATTLRVVAGERVLSDGPFAETKEQLGGFYLLDCKDLDEALDWAERCPAAQAGAIEIRPVMDYEQTGYDDPRNSEEVSG
jgi:hypothetical protein